MKYYDFFNGDADGIISLHQYRLQFPQKNEVFTGVKRDVKLLRHAVEIKNSTLSVFDISLLSNKDYIDEVLNNNNRVTWFDHHEPGEIDLGENFSIKVDADPNCCTNILVDKYVDGLHRPWTICGAYGDNLHEQAEKLNNNNRVTWFDHHEPGETDLGESFSIKVDADPNCCTNILVDKYVDGLHRPWTICGAYGDNLHEQAEKLNPCFNEMIMLELKEIGETLNYNGYGNELSDLTVDPKEVYLDLHQYVSPFQYRKKSEIYNKIHTQMISDKAELSSSEILHDTDTGKVILLPNTKASVRYSGIYSNQQTTDDPDKAFAILTLVDEENYRVSIRSPKTNPYGASKLALQFPTGGGREKAAGVNELPRSELNNFIEKFEEVYRS